MIFSHNYQNKIDRERINNCQQEVIVIHHFSLYCFCKIKMFDNKVKNKKTIIILTVVTIFNCK